MPCRMESSRRAFPLACSAVLPYGMCDDCIMIDPDETEMKMRRKRQVDIFDARDEYMDYLLQKREMGLEDEE